MAASVFAQSAAQPTQDKPTVLLVVGAPGEEEFGKNFEKWAGLWEKTCHEAGANLITIGLKSPTETNDLDHLKEALLKEPKESASELWLVLIGHGTFDGKEAKFNLHGPDLSAAELSALLQPFHRPLAVINCASSSGPFINKLCASLPPTPRASSPASPAHQPSAFGRVIITATKSGAEQNYARFGQYLAEAIADPQADLDKDGQTSLLEAYLTASSRVAEFYKAEGRLATEHALIEDNGDGLGTPADWFRGIRAVKKAKEGASLDGVRAHQFHLLRSQQEQKMPASQRARRDELELTVAKLRDTKSQVNEDEYYRQLEPVLIELARLYEADALQKIPKVINQAEDGSVALHAKNATIHGSTVRYEPQPHKNTVGYWTKLEDWVSWDFKLEQPGTFSVEVTQACSKDSSGSEYSIAVGDQVLTDKVPDTGAFTNFVNRTLGTFKIGQPGSYTLSVKPIIKPGLAVMDLRAVTLKLKQ